MTWLAGWTKRIELTLDNGDVNADLENFPVLIHLSTSSGRNSTDVSCVFDELTADANRKKIAVTESDGITQCYVEIEKWDDANEEAWLWTKVPALSSSADTKIYLYYDSTHADNDTYVGDTNSTPAENVWNNGYFISHMKDDPDTSHIRDSSSYSSDGDKAAANQPVEAAGDKTAYAQDFNSGNPDYIEIPANQTQLNFTAGDFSMIIRLIIDDLTTYPDLLMRGSAGLDGYRASISSSGMLIVRTEQSGATQLTYATVGSISEGVNYTLGFKRVGASIRTYRDGVDNTNTIGTHANPATCARTAKIGVGDNLSSNPLNGRIEFLGIFGAALGTPFHKAFDQSIIDDLAAFGAEEDMPFADAYWDFFTWG